MRRPGVTLLEVLISLFVMAIGLLALLTLFPLGALRMGQALQADRAASAAQLATGGAESMRLRSDPDVTAALDAAGTVFVDAFGTAINLGPLGAAAPSTPGVPRARPSYAGTPALAARWFSLPDDMSFGPDGKPAGGLVQRGGRYTWAYLLRRERAERLTVVDLTVVVYSGRDTQTGTGELVYAASGAKGEAGLTLTSAAGQPRPGLRRGGWLLDVTVDGATSRPRAEFYRVGTASPSGPASVALEVEPVLSAPVGTVVVLDNAVEVFRMGTGR